MPVKTGNSTQALGGLSDASRPGRIPMVWPPSPRAPRQAASMMPPPPPQQTVTPRFASSRPTASARRFASGGASSPPITDMIIAGAMIPVALPRGNESVRGRPEACPERSRRGRLYDAGGRISARPEARRRASAGAQRPAVAGGLRRAVRHGRDHDCGLAVQHDLGPVPRVQLKAAHGGAVPALDDLYDEPLGQGLLDAAEPLGLPTAVAVRSVAETELRNGDVVDGEAAAVGGVVGDVLEAQEDFAAGEWGQVHNLLHPLAPAVAGVTWAVGHAHGVVIAGVRGGQRPPRLAAVRGGGHVGEW